MSNETKETSTDSVNSIDWLATPFALFVGATYYPSPGWRGYAGQHETVEQAKERGEKLAEECFGWWQVVDLRSLEIVDGEGQGHTGLFGYCPAG